MSRVDSARRTLGQQAEDQALGHFLQQGFCYIDRNWRLRSGEIDLIVLKDRTLHFVEVKARASTYEHPFAAISSKKRQRIQQTVEAWLLLHPEYAGFSYQIDALCFWKDTNQRWQQAWLEGM